MQEELLQSMFDSQERHWWFTTKRNIVVDQIDRALDPKTSVRVLDVGCGSGLMIKVLEKYGDVYGLDASEQCLEFCRKLGGANLCRGELPDLVPYLPNSFALITALDVIEHIDNDIGSLDKIFELLEAEGLLLLTVPALNFMWTRFDEVNNHKRRYSKNELHRKLVGAGFVVESISYYNSLLFPLAFVGRMYTKFFGSKSTSEVDPPMPVVNWVFTKIFGLERYYLRRFRFPIGLSLIAVARRSTKSVNHNLSVESKQSA
jgi:2-polyprenyl-3-methyl-5-hydroxy-6-metoxy-1,4-benzoquinol methylase